MNALNHFRRDGCTSILVSFLMMHSAFAASSGSIVGRVLDKVTGDPLPGATVMIQGTSIGGSTSLDGKYELRNVPTGSHWVRVVYVGYLTETLEMTVGENATLTQEFRLVPQALLGEAVEVTAQSKGQMKAINQQLSANNIVNVVSAEKMKELPDANLAESIGRLPGVSIQRDAGEASKIVVRGLSPKFNRVTVEGVPMVSTSNSDRSIDLSLIGDDLVKGVELSKSLRPDMDADAIGGSINLTLRQAPEDYHFEVAGNGGYNQLYREWKNYKFTASVSDRFFDNALGARLQFSAEQKQLPSQQFGGYYGSPQLYPGSTPPQFYINTESAVLTVNQQKRNRNGASAIIDFTSELVDISFFNMFSEKNDDVTSSANDISFLYAGADGGFSREYTLTSYKTSERTHSLQPLFKFGNTKLSLSLSYSNARTSAPGQYFPFLEANTNDPFLSASVLQNAQPSALIAAMGASNPANTYLTALCYFNTTLLDESYDAKIDYRVPIKLSDDISGTLSLGGKYHGVRRESDGSGQVIPLGPGCRQVRDDLMAHFPWIVPTSGDEHGIIATNFLDPDFHPGRFLDGRYALDWSASIPLLHYVGSYLYDIPGRPSMIPRDGTADYQDDYAALEDVYAGYAMAEFNLFDNRLTVLPGMRVERNWTRYQAYQISLNSSNGNGLGGIPKSVTTDQRNDLWFPSVNLKYKLTSDIQIMGAVYKNEAKPNFEEISPLVIYENAVSNSFRANNPFLKPATAINYDLSVSIFNNEIGLFTVGGFYKEISNLIISLVNYQPYQNAEWMNYPADLPGRLPALTYYDTTWFSLNPTAAATIPINNPEKAYIRGIEFSWQTHFWFLPGVLTGLVLDLNLSFIGSNTQYPYFYPVLIGYKPGRQPVPINGEDYRTRAGAVVDQPKSIANAIIGWDHKGFSTRVSLRYQQTTLTRLDSKFSLSDSYYDNFLIVDISARQQVLDNLALFASVTNVTSHIDDYYINGVTGRLPTSSQTYGLRTQFGVAYNY